MPYVKIFKEKAGVISKKPVWICFYRYYMYTGDTLYLLIKDMLKYWNSESRIIV